MFITIFIESRCSFFYRSKYFIIVNIAKAGRSCRMIDPNSVNHC